METSDLGGKRLSKNSLQIHLIGALDELNAHLGLAKARLAEEANKKYLESVQIKLMKLMSYISDPSNKNFFFTDNDTADLDKEIDSLKNISPVSEEFVLPGKNETEAVIHIARTIARRAERCYAALNEQVPLCRKAASYLNKLSDYLFYLACCN